MARTMGTSCARLVVASAATVTCSSAVCGDLCVVGLRKCVSSGVHHQTRIRVYEVIFPCRVVARSPQAGFWAFFDRAHLVSALLACSFVGRPGLGVE